MGAHEDWVARDAAVVWHGFTQMATYADNRPVVVDRAEGHEIVDVDGNRYLDAVSSLWVTTLGHRVPELDQAVRDQLDRVAHSTLLGNGNRAVVELAEALVPVVPVDGPHFLFASDGAAAVEQALRIAFQYWTNRGVTGRTSYLAFGGAYHGDTIGSLAVGDGGFGTDVYDPLRFPVRRAPSLAEPAGAGPAIELLAAHADELAAVVVEPLVQGAAGMWVHEPAELAALAAACQEHGVLLVADEVATGFGRTGTLFACEQAGIRPDLLVIGKGLTGGYLPMSATVAADHVHRAFLGPDLSELTLYHGHSYSGNALAAAVARRHLSLLDEQDVLANVRARGEQIGAALAERVAPLPGVAEVRRCGLMTGVELAPPAEGLRWGRRVTAACVDRGVLIRPLGDVIVLMPPLTVTPDEVDRIVDTLAAAVAEVCAVSDGPWSGRIAARLDSIRASGRWRSVRPLEGTGPEFTLDGRPVVSFASNDYLGLAAHPAVVHAATEALGRWGAGTGAARLVVGDRPVHHDLEAEVADWKGTDAAVLFPTGFAANLGVLATLGTEGTLICSDELNHASIIDGARLARAEVTVFPHRDLDALGRLLDRAAADGRPALVVTDTVFSMDGDAVDVDAVAELCSRRGALLVLDEAHAVLGPPFDPGAHPGLALVRVGTLSKTLGSLGGFAATTRDVADLLVNAARPYIFTTGSTPADTAAGLAALRVLRSAEGDSLVARLRSLVDRVRPGHPSPIVPVVLGDEAVAVAAADALLAQGLLVPAIRPPTVAPGSSRLRVTLSAAHSDADVDRLLAALADLGSLAPPSTTGPRP